MKYTTWSAPGAAKVEIVAPLSRVERCGNGRVGHSLLSVPGKEFCQPKWTEIFTGRLATTFQAHAGPEADTRLPGATRMVSLFDALPDPRVRQAARSLCITAEIAGTKRNAKSTVDNRRPRKTKQE